MEILQDIEQITLFGRKKINVFANRPSSLKEIFHNTVQNDCYKEALFLNGIAMTYDELDRKSTKLAASLQKKYGVEKEDRLVCLIGNNLEFPLVAIACIKIGAVMIPVNTKLTSSEIAYIIGHSKPKLIIADNELVPVVEECNKKNKHVIPYTKVIIQTGSNPPTDTIASLLTEKYDLQEVEIDETDPVYILYTSGTTGRPKGAVLSHVNVVHSLMHYQRIFQTTNAMRTMIAVPLFHVTGLVAQFLHMIYIGGSSVILKRYNNDEYIKQSYDLKVDLQFNVPTIFIMMATSPLLKERSFDFVKRVAYGGSPIYEQTLQRLQEIFPNATFHNAYGATETTSPTALMPLHYPLTKVAAVGLPVDTAEVKVVDASGKEAGINEVGELWIKGPMVIGSYWDNPAANESSFVDGYWRSGDIAKIDEDGFIYILDRMKDMINRGGEKIFSIEVENVLKSHPEVKEAAVIAIPDDIFGEKVKAVIVSDRLQASNQDTIRSYCARHLAKFKIPEVYEFVEELPKTASGKILKHQLRV
ncbi:class I adenylate-forming enzyme family protein [Sporosarcina soli]|uniref:Class I adenylate-forming enzyme family protein n=1 Tax=Sporosarcina soli TaxID=334736 RepID=A0ABW0TJ08_9BACL